MFRILLSLALLLSCQPAVAQEFIQGTLRDADSGEPVPFANIGIPDQQTGTVSDENGRYRLPVRAEPDAAIISAIGYATERYSLKELRAAPDLLLQPQAYLTDSVVVRASRLGPEQELGYRMAKRGNSIGMTGRLLGFEIGARIPVEKETLLKKAHFTLNHAKGDTVLLRVNLYRWGDGRPGEPLLLENILLEAGRERGTLTVDLSAYELIVYEDVFLALEWVKDFSGLLEAGITFRCKSSPARNANLYTRLTSHAPYVKMNMALGFYLTGRPVD